MPNNQWEIIGDHLPTKSPIEFKDNSIVCDILYERIHTLTLQKD